jgi:hypothetical protein
MLITIMYAMITKYLCKHTQTLYFTLGVMQRYLKRGYVTVVFCCLSATCSFWGVAYKVSDCI